MSAETKTPEYREIHIYDNYGSYKNTVTAPIVDSPVKSPVKSPLTSPISTTSKKFQDEINFMKHAFSNKKNLLFMKIMTPVESEKINNKVIKTEKFLINNLSIRKPKLKLELNHRCVLCKNNTHFTAVCWYLCTKP